MALSLKNLTNNIKSKNKFVSHIIMEEEELQLTLKCDNSKDWQHFSKGNGRFESCASLNCSTVKCVRCCKSGNGEKNRREGL